MARRLNGEWESLQGGEGIVCHKCGEIVPLCYQKRADGERYGLAIYAFCPKCFDGEKSNALTIRLGGERTND